MKRITIVLAGLLFTFGLTAESFGGKLKLISIGYSFLNGTENHKSTSHKQKKEFTPPELPYCKIKYYDSNSVVIDFWQKDGKKRELHYLVTNITEGMYSATVEFKHSSNGKDYGAWELNGEERAYLTDVCLYRAAKKILKGEMLTYGNALNEDLLRIEKVSGDVRDTITYDLVESDY